MPINEQGFRVRAQEWTAAARDRVRRVAAALQDDARLRERRAAAEARLHAAVRDQLDRVSLGSPVRNPPRRSPPGDDDFPDSWLR
ncbi:MAG: hypothetical protein ACR2FQ_10445 [Pseudonocardiaceae bacterium]